MCKIKPDNHTYELRGRIQADAINANAPVRKKANACNDQIFKFTANNE